MSFVARKHRHKLSLQRWVFVIHHSKAVTHFGEIRLHIADTVLGCVGSLTSAESLQASNGSSRT